MKLMSVEGVFNFEAEYAAEVNRMRMAERAVKRAWRAADRWQASAPKREAKLAAKVERQTKALELRIARKQARAEAKLAAMKERADKAEALAAELSAKQAVERAKWEHRMDHYCKFVGNAEQAAA